MKKIILILLLVSSLSIAQDKNGVDPGAPRSDFDLSEVKKIPIQNGGRIKPLDSFARESLLFILGSKTIKGWDPLDLIFSWISFPDVWGERAFIKIDSPDVRKQLLLDEKRVYFSPRELSHNPVLIQYGQSMASGGQSQAPGRVTSVDLRESDLKKVLSRMTLFSQLVSGSAWTVIPHEENWKSLEELKKLPQGRSISTAFAALIGAYFKKNKDQFEDVAVDIQSQYSTQVKDWDAIGKKVRAEAFYLKVRPFLVSWILYLLAGLLWILAMIKKKVGSFALE